MEAAALAGAPDGTRLEVVMEPTGPAWLPVELFFAGRCHLVYRVPSAKAADLRRFLSRHVKSNQIGAERYTVPEEVRRRRRSTKPRAGKAPQQVPRRSLPSRRRRRAHPDA